LDEQISRVEKGLDPMNVWRDRSPDVIFGAGEPPHGWTGNLATFNPPKVGQDYRRMYHKGFAIDDADRYGPMLEQIKDLHRRIEESGMAAAPQKKVEGQLVVSE
jgi:5,5'-dehydrodivanillate O-demethylase